MLCPEKKLFLITRFWIKKYDIKTNLMLDFSTIAVITMAEVVGLAIDGLGSRVVRVYAKFSLVASTGNI